MIVRESDGPITDYYSRVVPHAIGDGLSRRTSASSCCGAPSAAPRARRASAPTRVGRVTELRDDTVRRLHRTVLDRQRAGRVPGVFAGVVRGGGLVWQEGVGAADLADPDDRARRRTTSSWSPPTPRPSPRCW